MPKRVKGANIHGPLVKVIVKIHVARQYGPAGANSYIHLYKNPMKVESHAFTCRQHCIVRRIPQSFLTIMFRIANGRIIGMPR